MKKTLRILLPIILSIVIILCMCWYLFIYDREFTRDMLLGFARFSESKGNHAVATWFYNQAYAQSGNSDAVAIELAEQYKSSGNYTKAEFTLCNAIADGAGIDVYIALSKVYVEQDKLLDAVNMLNNVTNAEVKHQLEIMRPTAPVASPTPGFYTQYISVALQSEMSTIYASGNGKYPSTTTNRYTVPLQLTDGENTICAVAIDDNGLVSPLSTFVYTVGGVIQKMEFADTAMEAAIRSTLNVSEEKELYTNDLWTIKEFTIPSAAVDYADLKHMSFLESLTIESGASGQLHHLSNLSNLTHLTISKTSVSQEDLQVIGSRPVLKELTLASCSITGIAPLDNATGLVKLDLNNNTIRNIDAIGAMKDLQELNLQHNAVENISALKDNVQLTQLDISYNSISSLSPIANLSILSRVDASTNTLSDLGNLERLTSLSYLNLASNALTDVSPISACSNLKDLNISSNELTDISALSALGNLMYFDFSYNQVTTLPSFNKNCALVTITGSNNKLSSLDPLGGLQYLNNVNMDYNSEISSVKALASCPVLIEVNVFATKVTNVTALTNQSIIVNYNPVQ